MFGKKPKQPSRLSNLRDFGKLMAQISMAAVIITNLGAGIIYHGVAYSADKTKTDDETAAYEALATTNETSDINETFNTNETDRNKTKTANETGRASKTKTDDETETDQAQEKETTETIESDNEAEISAEADSLLLVNESGSLVEDNIQVVMNILQLHPNYLEDILSLHASWNELETKLTQTLKGYSGNWSVYVKDLKTGDTISLNEQSMESASLIKLYVMGAVIEQIYNGNLEETSRITSLLNDMITVSDNSATNELVRSLSKSRDHKEGMSVVNDFIKRHGYTNTKQINGLADSSLWSGNGVNSTSARDCGALLESIYNGELVSHLASRKMENLLLGQKVTYKIPQALPSGAISASKTGEVSQVENDVAIVYSKGGDFILCIMSGEWYIQSAAISNIHEITKIVYEYFNT